MTLTDMVHHGLTGKRIHNSFERWVGLSQIYLSKSWLKTSASIQLLQIEF